MLDGVILPCFHRLEARLKIVVSIHLIDVRVVNHVHVLGRERHMLALATEDELGVQSRTKVVDGVVEVSRQLLLLEHVGFEFQHDVTELRVMLVVDTLLHSLEGVGAFEHWLHLKSVKLVDGPLLFGVFIRLDDETLTLFVGDGILKAAKLNTDLVGPAALHFLEDTGDGDGARFSVD